MHTIHPLLTRAAQVAAMTVFAAGLCLQAQQTAPVVPSTARAVPSPNLQAALKMPVNPFDADGASSSSSSNSSSATDAVSAERLSLSSDSMQPPPRRRYGRPRYTDSAHNPDGSNKYTFEIGGGLTLPVGGTKNYAKTSYSFQGGVGRNFNKNLGVIAQFDWDNFGIQTNTLNTLLAEYNREITAYNNANPSQTAVSLLTQVGGSTHVWSFTLNPIYNLTGGEKLGAYVTGGAGFYHKATSITTPATGTYCDYYYGCYQYQANSPIDSYISNAIGVNGGVGFTYKLSRFANERLFGEVRYVYTANQRRPYYNGTTGTSLSTTYFNVFPQNSAPTTYIPVKFGLRF